MIEYKDEEENDDKSSLQQDPAKIQKILKLANLLPKDGENEVIQHIFNELFSNFENKLYDEAEIALVSLNPLTLSIYIPNLSYPLLEEFCFILLHYINSESAFDIITQSMLLIYNLLLIKEVNNFNFNSFFVNNELPLLFRQIIDEEKSQQYSISVDHVTLYKILAILSSFSPDVFELCLSFIDFQYFDLSIQFKDSELVTTILFFISHLISNENTSPDDAFINDTLTFIIHTISQFQDDNKNIILSCLNLIVDFIKYQSNTNILNIIKQNDELLHILNTFLTNFLLDYFPQISYIYLMLSKTEKLPPFMLKAFLDAVASCETLDNRLNDFFHNAVQIISIHLFDKESESLCISEGCLNALRTICDDCSFFVRKDALFLLCRFLIEYSESNPQQVLFDDSSEELNEIKEIYTLLKENEKESSDSVLDENEIEDYINELFVLLDSFPIINT